MTRSTPSAAVPAGPKEAPLDHAALLAALGQLVEPLARLAVSQGLPYATVEELLKQAFVTSAKAAQPASAGTRLVSRVSAATGLNRRDVTRLMQQSEGGEHPPKRRSPATEVFTRWLSDPSLQSPSGEPLALRRQGEAPSFESLARSVTHDVHPRSLLDELCRLGLAEADAQGDRVHLLRDRFVPQGDSERMLGFLGSNVGDHLRAAVANVLSHSAPPHLEQAVFADGLSLSSLDSVQATMRTHWKSLLSSTVPQLQALIERDQAEASEVPADQRVRIGLYMYTESMPSAPPAPADGRPPAPRGARSRKVSP